MGPGLPELRPTGVRLVWANLAALEDSDEVERQLLGLIDAGYVPQGPPVAVGNAGVCFYLVKLEAK